MSREQHIQVIKEEIQSLILLQKRLENMTDEQYNEYYGIEETEQVEVE